MGLANANERVLPFSPPLSLFLFLFSCAWWVARDARGGCQLAYGQLQVLQTRYSSIWSSMAGSLDKRELQFVALPAYQFDLLS